MVCFFSTTFKLSILIILYEDKTQRMDKRTDRTKSDVDRVAYQQDDQHTDRTQHDVHTFRHIHSQRIEYATQDRTGQADSEQTDIRQCITQQSGSML